MEEVKKVLPSLSEDDIEELLLEKLPHGSGIDCKWEVNFLKNGAAVASNSFHCMDEHGYYCGYADFSVKFREPRADLKEFDLAFKGDQAQRLNKRHMLRDYLEDTIHHAVAYGQ